jgi:Tfp pilus assembly protein PilF
MSQATSNELLEKSTLELAQILADKCAIAPNDWHRLKSNRKAQANQHITAALVYLQTSQTEEALAHLQQAVGWLDRSLSAPPCPTHGNH